MLCANQESDRRGLDVPVASARRCIVDWLPWNHTFGGNHNFNMMLRNGGTLYIDEGKPVPALIGRTVANLQGGVAHRLFQRAARLCGRCSTIWRRMQALQRSFFARLDLLFYAAAALPQTLWDRLEELSSRCAAARCRSSRPGA